MTPSALDFESSRFSADTLGPAHRLPFYREIMDRTIERAEIEATGEPFSFEADVYRIPELGVVCARASGTRVRRTHESAETSPKLFLMMLLEGTATISQFNKEATVAAGHSVLFSGAKPFRMERSASRFVLIGIPQAVLEPMINSLSDAALSVVPSRTDAIRLLTGYVELFMRESAIETPRLRSIAAHHVHDLVAVAVGATRDAAEIAKGRGVAVARLHAIKSEIMHNLAGRLSADALAAHHRVSARYIRKLFERENMSLSQFVLDQRLARVHRLLTDPRQAHLTIAGIAFDAGLRDLSTFNRQFRRRFGMTPSEVRAAYRDAR